MTPDTYCESCLEPITEDDTVLEVEGNFYHGECFSNVECPAMCNRPHTCDPGDRCPVEGSPIQRCESCYELGFEGDMHAEVGWRRSTWYCESCYWEIFTTCDECNETIYRDDMFVTDGGDCLCDSCYESQGTRYTPCPPNPPRWFHPFTEAFANSLTCPGEGWLAVAA